MVSCTAMPFADNAFSGCTDMTMHILPQNTALAQYCDSRSIPYVDLTGLTYTLTLCKNNGEADMTNTRAWKEALALATPVWEGHTFSGWFYDEALTSRCTLNSMPAQNLTLYAAWDRNVYQLTLDLNGGSAEKTVYTFSSGTHVCVNSPIREGYYFTGWTTDESGSVPFDGLMPEGNTILYASWHSISVNGRYRMDVDHATLIAYLTLEEEDSSVYLPEMVDGLPLTGIAAGAFVDSTATELFISATVTHIAVGAFKGSRLRSISVSEENPAYRSKNSVIYSADGSELIFFPPVANYHLSIPTGVSRIASYAFDGTDLRSIVLNQDLQEICEGAFRDTKISLLTLPASLQSVGERAFFGCRSLYCVEAESSPTSIGGYAFAGCGSFLSVYGPDAECALRSAAKAVGARYNAYLLTLNLPLGTTKYVQEAGTELMLPSAPEAGENLQFTGWFSDEDAAMPFTGSIMPASDLTLYAGTEAVFENEVLTDPESGELTGLLITVCRAHDTNPTVPETIGGKPVTGIAAGAFDARYTRVTLPTGILEIDPAAFALGTILVCEPGSAAEAAAGGAGFSVNGRVWTLHWDSGFPLSVEDERHALGTAIQTPTLERSGYELLGWFYDTGFSSPLNPDDTMPARDLTLYARWGVVEEESAQVADELLWTLSGDEITVTGYTGMTETLIIPATLHGKPVTAIAANAFACNYSITELVLPDSITDVGESAFFAMCNLRRITLSTALHELPANVLANSGLTELTVPAALQTIDPTALRGCAGLTAISVEDGNPFYYSRDGVLYDGADHTLFKYPAAKQNTSFTIEEAWAVSPWAFENAASLQSVSFSDAPYSLGEGAFRGCCGLTELTSLDGRLVRIPDECFYGCASLCINTLPDTVQSLGRFALAGTGITELTVPASLTAIDPLALNSRVVLRGESGSYAQTWAEEKGRSFISTDTVPVESITLSDHEITLLRGERLDLAVTVTPGEADVSAIRFFSANENIVRVDETGMLYAVGGGSTRIFITAPGGVEASCPVSVEVLPESFTILYSGRYSCSVGDCFSVGSEFLPRKVTNPEVVYSSSNPSVAEITEDGTITTMKAGVTLITACPVADESMSRSFLLLCAVPEASVLPGSLSMLEEEALAGSAFGYVMIPDTITEIGDRAFADSPNLCLVEFTDPEPDLGENVFSNCPNLTLLAPSGSSTEAYAGQYSIPFIALEALD